MDRGKPIKRPNSNNGEAKTTVAGLSMRAASCITHVKRTFILAFVLTFLSMFIMYTTSEHFNKIITVTTVKRMGDDFVIIRNKLNWASSIQTTRNTDSSSSEYVKRNNSANDSVGLNGTKVVGVSVLNLTTQRFPEFPGMPDPCAKPRRNTGVEDILCMERPAFLPDYKNPCWFDRGRFRCLPYFHLFGICKSGTSDLFKRILLHPEIVPNKGIFGKEIWYWSWKRFDSKNRAGLTRLGMTLREFTDQFYSDKIKNGVNSNGFHELVTGHGDPMDFWDRFAEEKTPQNRPGAEELLWTTPYSIRHINPDVKLLLMLRDPIDRLYSHYFHSGAGTSAQSFDEHIRYSIPLWKQCLQEHTLRSCIYSQELRRTLKAPIYTSFYVVHMKEWLKVFPRDQILIFRNEDYAKDMRGILNNVFQFLKVSSPKDSLLDEMVKLPHFYETKRKATAGPMLDGTRRLLVDLYRPYTEELAKLLGDDRFAFRDESFG